MVFFFPYYNTRQWRLLAVAVACTCVVVMMMSGAMGDSSSKEKEECTEQVAGLATCLPYVGGQAKSPTPDCCTGLKQLLNNNNKCLCLIIKDRNDPDIGSLHINITLAISLPNVCNAPSNVSKCPELLHMDPKSPEAQIFYQLDKASNKNAPSPTAGASGDSGKSGSSQEVSAPHKNEASFTRRSLFGLRAFLIGLHIWVFMGFT